jgi:uncharacterized protein YkwD
MPYGVGSSGPEEARYRGLLEYVIWQGTNRMREKGGLRPLFFHTSTGQVAYLHSKDLCRRKFFDHVNPDGAGPADRLQAAGVSFTMCGENIIMLDTARTLLATASMGKALGDNLVRSWMDSPGHRANIMEGRFREIGVGVYLTKDDVFATQVFRA